MSVMFSRITASTGEKTNVIFVGGYPKTISELNQLPELCSCLSAPGTDIALTVEAFASFHGSTFDNSPDSMALIRQSLEQDPVFLSRCMFVGRHDMQVRWSGSQIIDPKKEESEMNEFDRMRRLAQVVKEQYPAGTRILLERMGDDPRPVEPNTRGTVLFVDDIATVHVQFDNGRCLGLIPGEDEFRRLTAEELAQENNPGEAEGIGPAMTM